MYVAGADGCRGGWAVALYNTVNRALTFEVAPSFREVLSSCKHTRHVAVDIPIGLPEAETRDADALAKKLLKQRASCIFPAPDRRLLLSGSYPEANRRSRQLPGRGISRQTYNLLGKIREVDDEMSPDLQQRVFEMHPEVSFCALAGSPLEYPKRTAEGYLRRRQLLGAALEGAQLPDREAVRCLLPRAAPDDLLDAVVGVWTALRVAGGNESRLPDHTQRDSRGLRMEIVY